MSRVTNYETSNSKRTERRRNNNLLSTLFKNLSDLYLQKISFSQGPMYIYFSVRANQNSDSRLHLCRKVRPPPHPTSVLDMTLKYLIARLQSWSVVQTNGLVSIELLVLHNNTWNPLAVSKRMRIGE